MRGAILPVPQHTFMCGAHLKHTDNVLCFHESNGIAKCYIVPTVNVFGLILVSKHCSEFL
jgi:hypothetical protein